MDVTRRILSSCCGGLRARSASEGQWRWSSPALRASCQAWRRDVKGARPLFHGYARRSGNFVLVFSTHAPHQGAFSRLPGSPRLPGEREKTGNGAPTQGSAGAPPRATNIPPLAGLPQNPQPFRLLTPCRNQRCSSLRSQGYQGRQPLVS